MGPRSVLPTLTGIRIPSADNYCRQCVVVVPEVITLAITGLAVTTRGTRPRRCFCCSGSSMTMLAFEYDC
jgi:hypothetical protein